MLDLAGPGEAVYILAIISSHYFDGLDVVNQGCQGQIQGDEKRQLGIRVNEDFFLVIICNLKRVSNTFMQASTAWEQILFVGTEETSSVFMWQEPMENEVYLLLWINTINILVMELQVLYLFFEESLELFILYG